MKELAESKKAKPTVTTVNKVKKNVFGKSKDCLMKKKHPEEDICEDADFDLDLSDHTLDDAVSDIELSSDNLQVNKQPVKGDYVVVEFIKNVFYVGQLLTEKNEVNEVEFFCAKAKKVMDLWCLKPLISVL